MFKNFEGLVERTREMFYGPREVQFENGIKLVTRVRNSEPSLKFVKEDEEIFDLKSLAPEETKIIFDPKNKWQACAKTKEIYIGKFMGADCVLVFLHEVGHINRPEDSDISNRVNSIYFEEKFKDGRDLSGEELGELLKVASQEVIQGERNA